MVKNPPANAGVVREVSSISGWGRSPGGGHGNPLRYSCLENPMERGAWQAIVQRVAESQTRLKRLSAAQHSFTPMPPNSEVLLLPAIMRSRVFPRVLSNFTLCGRTAF